MAVADVLSGPLPESAHRTQLRRAVIASTVGTTIEWYDFLLYSVVTGLVFAKLFFPKSDPLVGVLEAFAIYFVGFIARPIGAAIFGHYGDRIGRKGALIATLLLTGLATFAVGFVPTYDSIGVWGAVILTVVRFIQGIGSAANGAARCCWRWNGLAPISIAASSAPGRNWAALAVSCSPIWRCCSSVGFPATSSSSGAGGYRSCSAS